MWHQLASALKDGGQHPADIFSQSFDPHEVPGVDPEMAVRIETLLDDGASATLEVEELSRKGIWTITIIDDAYPHSLMTRLGPQAPPVLFGAGNAALLQMPGIGIVGSRDVEQPGADVAAAIAQQAVSLGHSVVSGGARGIDQLAMNAAYQADGSVIGVLADSLIGRIRKSDVLQALDNGNTCLVAQQVPAAGFTPASAMSRNKLVYAFSEATVIVASADGTGGTWTGAVEAVRAGNGTVIVWRGAGEGPGNAGLERLGGRTMTSVEDLASLIGSSEEPVQQLSLDLPR
jgi:predicted Rossmann fold nucleotide-binding protein DprA/Smf involved in DNA uptake